MLTAVVEGSSDEGAVAKLLAAVDLSVDRWLIMGGKSHLDARLPVYARAATQVPGDRYVVFRDTDDRCPAELRTALLANTVPGSPLMLRLAHPEIEAWLLGDAAAVAAWLGVPMSAVPLSPEDTGNAKEALLALARRSRRRELRDALVRSDGKPGQRYVAEVNAFASGFWHPQAARQTCPSLGRAIRALEAW